jgi:3alpha(or 20beta)-hydroxysteroid dehydrogenase
VSNRLDGKVAMITGGARGQGEAEARLFVAEGAKVVITDVLDELGQALAADLGESAMYVHLDVTSEDDWSAAVAATVERFGPPTVLVNNAGISGHRTIDQMAKEELLALFSVNVLGPWLGTKTVFDSMRRAGGGSIVNIGSTNSVRGEAGGTAYTTSKHALAGLTKSSAIELGPFGIRVNLVLPGGIKTPMSATSASWYGTGVLDTKPSEWALPFAALGQARGDCLLGALPSLGRG